MIDRFSGLEVDWQAMELSRDGAQVPVKPKAFQLLEFLFANRDRVVSKYEIFETVWQGRFVSDGVLTTAVNDLRRALGDTGKKHHIIRTIYGQGLRFVADLENQEAADEVAPAEGTTVSEAALTASEIQSDPNSKVTVGLAVLALENLSTDPELSRLGDVVAEDLITALSKFSQLSVVSRTSSFAVSHQSTPLREIAETLGVDYIVEGSLRPVDDIARVSVQLIDASDDQHVWAEQFDWKVSCTAGEESMTLGVITGQLVDQLTRHEARSARHVAVEDLTAWQSYYRGIAALYTHRFAERNNAIAFFERAIELNPEFALARALLSFALNMPNLVLSDGRFQSADDAVIRQDLERAEKEALQSLDLDPRYAFAWVSLARTYISLGHPYEGMGAAQTAIDLNPFLPAALFILGECYWSTGQLEDAVAACDRCIELGPSSVFYWLAMSTKSCALVALGKNNEAIFRSRDAQARSAGSVYSYFGEICALGHSGRVDDASDVIRRAERTTPGFCAALFDQLYPISDNQTAEHMHEGFKRAGLA